MLRIPANSTTARTPPAAITPVPSAAGRSTTRAGAEMPDDFMRNGAVVQRHADQAFLGAIDALANRLGHFVGLAQAEADQPVMIAGDHQRAEAEAASALHDLRDAVDMDDLLFDFETLRIDSLRDRAFS